MKYKVQIGKLSWEEPQALTGERFVEMTERYIFEYAEVKDGTKTYYFKEKPSNWTNALVEYKQRGSL